MSEPSHLNVNVPDVFFLDSTYIIGNFWTSTTISQTFLWVFNSFWQHGFSLKSLQQVSGV